MVPSIQMASVAGLAESAEAYSGFELSPIHRNSRPAIQLARIPSLTTVNVIDLQGMLSGFTSTLGTFAIWGKYLDQLFATSSSPPSRSLCAVLFRGRLSFVLLPLEGLAHGIFTKQSGEICLT